VSSADIFSDMGLLQMQKSELFGAKTSDFSKFMVCPHGQVGGDCNSVGIL